MNLSINLLFYYLLLDSVEFAHYVIFGRTCTARMFGLATNSLLSIPVKTVG